jgi:hypothetical protein
VQGLFRDLRELLDFREDAQNNSKSLLPRLWSAQDVRTLLNSSMSASAA